MRSLIRWDPFRNVRKWDPADEFRSMQHEMDRLFSRILGTELPLERARGVWTPSVESYIKDGNLVFKAELPGVDKKDLDVSITDRELVIKGERKAEKEAKEENYVYREIAYGSFERHFTLPEGAKTGDLKATFSNGILEITVPAPMISKARKIEIEAATDERKLSEAEVAKKAA